MSKEFRARDKSSVLSWIHLSDAHIGMKEQRRLWGRSSTRLKEDLKYLLGNVGPVDYVIFSGDMTQAGTPEQFDSFDSEISEFISCVEAEVGSRPKLISVPGNHDLVRPAAIRSEALALKQYWNSEELQGCLLQEEGRQYSDFIAEMFGPYSAWLQSSIKSGVHAQPELRGAFPGDCAYLHSSEHGTANLVTLNSAWLQVAGGNFKGKLNVDALQLIGLVGGNVDEWLSASAASILVTHHPVDWLHEQARDSWNRDICPAGRFDLHLYGHMHEHNVASVRYGGSKQRQTVQASSLFGLEGGEGRISRVQGYSAGAIKHDQSRFFESWPRILREMSGGDVKFVPDTSLDIDERTSSFRIDLSDRESGGSSKLSPDASVLSSDNANLVPTLGVRPFDLAKVRRSMLPGRAHLSVRRLEQKAVIDCLRARRITWLVSDWGLGHEEFYACIEHGLVGSGSGYLLDFSAYESRGDFLDSIQQNLGTSFQSISDAIADSGPSLVIFSDIDPGRTEDEGRRVQLDVEALAQAFSDFAPESYVILLGRNFPRSSSFGVSELKPLDEADLAVYLRCSEFGDGDQIRSEVVSRVMRHTDGFPDRINSTLKELEVGSLGDLVPSNPDLASTVIANVEAPSALVETVAELRLSEERQEKRAYNLLLALSALPQGERIARMKRFFGVDPIHTRHAIELLDRSLIKPRSISAGGLEDSMEKVLVVPKVVRDYIRESIGQAEAKSIDRKALELYFGESWSMGDISGSQAARSVREANCDGYEIQNVSVLSFRAVCRALESKDSFETSSAVRLSIALVESLHSGNHFRSAASLCEDLLSVLCDESDYTDDLNFIRRLYAESLRMSGNSDAAIREFEKVDRNALSKRDRQSTELHMALCYKRLGRFEDSGKLAKSLIPISPKSASANHARAILANMVEDEQDRIVELQRMLAVAQKAKQYTICSNIRIDLAGDMKDSAEARAILRDALKESDGVDFYTRARIIVQLAGLEGAAEWFTLEERDLLIDCYYYLYSERLLAMFERCHSALWNMFERDGDYGNLLNLFRHSSFIWRLTGEEVKEVKYLELLSAGASNMVVGTNSVFDKNKAYLVVRIAVVLGERAIQVNNDGRTL